MGMAPPERNPTGGDELSALHFPVMDDLLLLWIPVGLIFIVGAIAVPFMVMYAMS